MRSQRVKSNKKKRMEFSKMIVIGFLVSTVAILSVSFYLMYITSDLSALGEIILGLSAIGTSIFSFYFYKAKSENLIKIQQQYGSEIADKVKDLND